ncbi:MAG: enoyl-CoA hydratase-related protein [Pseudomonadota bacterium]
MSEGQVSVQTEGGVAELRIRNASRRNAFTQVMWLELEAQLDNLESDDDVRVVALRGDGGKAFSAGADIGELKTLLADPAALEQNNTLIRRVQLRLERFSKPTVALIEGACVGGGFGVALACDLRWARTDAVFAVTPSRLGLLYSLPDTHRMLRILGPTLTRELLFTGRRMNSDEALAKGMLTACISETDFEVEIAERLATLASASASALSGIKQTLSYLEGTSKRSSDEIDALFAAAFQSRDCREGARAFLEKRTPKFNQPGEDN